MTPWNIFDTSQAEPDWLGQLLALVRSRANRLGVPDAGVPVRPAASPAPLPLLVRSQAPALSPHPIAALDLPPMINTTQQAPLDTLDVNSINESIRKFLAGYLPGATGITPAGSTTPGRSVPTGTPGLTDREAPIYYR